MGSILLQIEIVLAKTEKLDKQIASNNNAATATAEAAEDQAPKNSENIGSTTAIMSGEEKKVAQLQ